MNRIGARRDRGCTRHRVAGGACFGDPIAIAASNPTLGAARMEGRHYGPVSHRAEHGASNHGALGIDELGLVGPAGSSTAGPLSAWRWVVAGRGVLLRARARRHRLERPSPEPRSFGSAPSPRPSPRSPCSCGSRAAWTRAPANDYLRAYQLVPAKASFRPATVRQLLTRTAGIGEVLHPAGLFRPLFGETVEPAAWCRRWPTTTGGSAHPGRAGHPVPARPTASPPSASSSRTSAASAWTALRRAPLPAPGHGRHQPGPIRTGPGAPGHRLHPGLPGPTSGHRL